MLEFLEFSILKNVLFCFNFNKFYSKSEIFFLLSEKAGLDSSRLIVLNEADWAEDLTGVGAGDFVLTTTIGVLGAEAGLRTVITAGGGWAAGVAGFTGAGAGAAGLAGDGAGVAGLAGAGVGTGAGVATAAGVATGAGTTTGAGTQPAGHWTGAGGQYTGAGGQYTGAGAGGQ